MQAPTAEDVGAALLEAGRPVMPLLLKRKLGPLARDRQVVYAVYRAYWPLVVTAMRQEKLSAGQHRHHCGSVSKSKPIKVRWSVGKEFRTVEF
jgi:hypothetical protein